MTVAQSCMRSSSEIVARYNFFWKELLRNEGKNIGSGLKAIAISVKIQSDNKTLEEDEINELSNQIVSSVKEKFDAKRHPWGLRGRHFGKFVSVLIRHELSPSLRVLSGDKPHHSLATDSPEVDRGFPVL